MKSFDKIKSDIRLFFNVLLSVKLSITVSWESKDSLKEKQNYQEFLSLFNK
jgi:hypothetical protein